MNILENYNYNLPEGLIAKEPSEARDGGRMLVVGENNRHLSVRDLVNELRPNDLLVVNRTKVMSARIHGSRMSGGAVEFLFLNHGDNPVRALIRPSKKIKENERLSITLGDEEVGVVVARSHLGGGEWLVDVTPSVEEVMRVAGELPLPPYMQRKASSIDSDRYQTVFASELGAVAAPTAGLHLSKNIIEELGVKGINLAEIVLHVGIGTFRTLRPEDIEAGELHEEWYLVPAETRQAIIKCREEGGRVVAVGTTVTRTLEAATNPNESVPIAGDGVTRIFLQEGYKFRCVDGLLTNFHLPQTSLLMLVSAFAGKERIFRAYNEAISERYRFYSYGDAMLIL